MKIRYVIALVPLAISASCSSWGSNACEELVDLACSVCPTGDYEQAYCKCRAEGTLSVGDISSSLQQTLQIDTNADADMQCTKWSMALAEPLPEELTRCERDLGYLKQHEVDACDGLESESWHYSEGKFESDFAHAVCSRYDECGWLEEFGWTMNDCLEPDTEDVEEVECRNYDSDAARQCVEDWENLSCSDLDAYRFPTSCNDVCEY